MVVVLFLQMNYEAINERLRVNSWHSDVYIEDLTEIDNGLVLL